MYKYKWDQMGVSVKGYPKQPIDKGKMNKAATPVPRGALFDPNPDIFQYVALKQAIQSKRSLSSS